MWGVRKRVFGTFIILLSVFSLISFGIWYHEKGILKKELDLKNSAKNTDLSTVLVDGHKLGETITKIDTSIFSVYFEDGSYASGRWGNNKKLSTSKIKLISGYFGMDGTEIKYRDLTATSFEEAKKLLGNNYIEGLPILGRTNTITYIDQVKNIELVLVTGGEYQDIYLKRIDDNLFRIAATPILKYRYDPFSVVHSITSKSGLNYLSNPFDYITLPLYFTLVMFPIVLLFVLKDRQIRRKILVFNIVLIILYCAIWFKGFWTALMSV